MDYRRLIEGYREQVTEYEPLEAATIEFDAVIDVREPMQRVEGSIDGSFAVPRSTLERDISGVVEDPDARILLYCVVGQSSILAAHTMQMLGYTNVSSLAGGFRQWRDEGLPWVVDDGLALDERIRYDRQLRLDRIGSAGQQRLLSSRALIVGAGGLGVPRRVVSRCGGRGHGRDRRRRPGRRDQPPSADHPRHRLGGAGPKPSRPPIESERSTPA